MIGRPRSRVANGHGRLLRSSPLAGPYVVLVLTGYEGFAERRWRRQSPTRPGMQGPLRTEGPGDQAHPLSDDGLAQPTPAALSFDTGSAGSGPDDEPTP